MTEAVEARLPTRRRRSSGSLPGVTTLLAALVLLLPVGVVASSSATAVADSLGFARLEPGSLDDAAKQARRCRDFKPSGWPALVVHKTSCKNGKRLVKATWRRSDSFAGVWRTRGWRCEWRVWGDLNHCTKHGRWIHYDNRE